MAQEDIKIVLVDDHTLFRNGMKRLIDSRSGYRVTGEYSDGAEFVANLESLTADVVFMDISMPTMNGDEATRIALQRCPDMRIVSLSMFGEDQYCVRMATAGAKSFLRKDSEIDTVFEAIDRVMAGEEYFSDEMMRSIRRSIREAEENPDALSEREVDVLLGICEGLSTQEIADRLYLSKRTVDAHRANILEKTGCKNTAALVVYAIKHALVEI